MDVGISTACFYPEYTEDAFIKLAKNNIKTTEVFFNSPSEIKREYLLKLKAVKEEYDINIVSIHPYSSSFEPLLFFTNYLRRFYDGVELYKQYFEAANILGAKIVVFHGDRKEGINSNELYFERYSILNETAKKSGVILAQENVSRCKSSSIDFIKRMCEELGSDVSFVLDIKQSIRSNLDPLELISVMGNRIKHVHLSDSKKGHDCLPIGNGSYDFSRLIKSLSDIEYDNNFIIELYRENYNCLNDLVTSYNYLKQIINIVR